MKPQMYAGAVGLILCTFASHTYAYDFSESDSLFVARSADATTVKAAVNSYNNIPTADLSTDERVYVAEQLAALYIYWGYVISESDTAQQVAIADQCLRAVAAIAPSASTAATPQYYFWQAACVMAKVHAQGAAASLANAQAIIDFIDKGRELDPSYEGGGFDRLAGVVYANLPSFNPFGPAGDIELALTLLTRSLDAAPFIHPLNPQWRDVATESGEYFYATVYYYADALARKGRRTEAKQAVTTALRAIASGQVAKGRGPETLLAKVKLQQLQRQL